MLYTYTYVIVGQKSVFTYSPYSLDHDIFFILTNNLIFRYMCTHKLALKSYHLFVEKKKKRNYFTVKMFIFHQKHCTEVISL